MGPRKTTKRHRAAIASVALTATAAVLLSAAISASARPAGVGQGDQPNILVVMTDDMASTDLEFMPNVRKLAKQGTEFTDAVDSFPLCCPARATFITGQYAHNHNVIANFFPYGWYGMRDRNNILPVWMQDAGYRTGALGKWLNGYGAKDGHGEIPAGFDIWRGLLDVSAYDYFNYVMNANNNIRTWGDPEFAHKLVEFGGIQTRPNPDGFSGVIGKLVEVFGPPPYDYWGTAEPKDYSPDVTGKMTRRLVEREQRRRKPFFLWWSPASPHREDVATTLMNRPGPDPRPPPRYADEVSKLELPKPPNFNEADISDKSANLKETADPLTEAEIEQLTLDYQGRAGSLMAVDDHVGKLVRTLRRTGQLKNTTIIFTSDNGWLHGEHRIPGDKFLPFEESLKVPLIIRGPGIPKGKKVRSQVSNVDFTPTLLDLAGAEAGRTQDGVSLLPGMRNAKKLPDRAIALEALRRLFTEESGIPNNNWDRPYQGVRTDRYTYVVWQETGEKELYDRKRDPYELENVAGDPEYAAIEAELAAKADLLADCKGKSCNVPQ
jgi:N-acetylglucosamine-6-sulfatase